MGARSFATHCPLALPLTCAATDCCSLRVPRTHDELHSFSRRRGFDRFYPGVHSAPSFPALGAGAPPSGVLDAPNGFSNGDNGFSNGNGSMPGSVRNMSAPRPQRVVGSLDHPILPMPPVRFPHAPQFLSYSYFLSFIDSARRSSPRWTSFLAMQSL